VEAVEVAGYRLRFTVRGPVVTVTDDRSGNHVGYAFGLDRPGGPWLNPSWTYREDLGTRADDPRGAEKRRQIAQCAKEVRDAAATDIRPE
jgi:hypothetical protein